VKWRASQRADHDVGRADVDLEADELRPDEAGDDAEAEAAAGRAIERRRGGPDHRRAGAARLLNRQASVDLGLPATCHPRMDRSTCGIGLEQIDDRSA
jgi:hypothetical protein